MTPEEKINNVVKQYQEGVINEPILSKDEIETICNSSLGSLDIAIALMTATIVNKMFYSDIQSECDETTA